MYHETLISSSLCQPSTRLVVAFVQAEVDYEEKIVKALDRRIIPVLALESQVVRTYIHKDKNADSEGTEEQLFKKGWVLEGQYSHIKSFRISILIFMYVRSYNMLTLDPETESLILDNDWEYTHGVMRIVPCHWPSHKDNRMLKETFKRLELDLEDKMSKQGFDWVEGPPNYIDDLYDNSEFFDEDFLTD